MGPRCAAPLVPGVAFGPAGILGVVRWLLVLLAVAAATVPSAGAAERARLRVTSTAPLVVRGSLFNARERVAVVAQAKGVHRRTVIATTRGTFVVVFHGVMLDHCASYIIRASGSGSYGYLRVIPECNPLEP